jgi:hypothetical protein
MQLMLMPVLHAQLMQHQTHTYLHMQAAFCGFGVPDTQAAIIVSTY